MTIHRLPRITFNPTPIIDRITELLSKPRTTNEIADRLKLDIDTAGQMLGAMARRGVIKKAEQRHGMQIWERVE